MEVILKLNPHSDESLSSYFHRLGKRNYYEEDNWFVHCFNLPRYTRPDFISEPTHLSTIALGTNLKVSEIRQMTAHRFVQYFYDTPGTPYWDESLRNTYLGRSKRCEACLEESESLMLPWMLRPITMCLKHQKLLVDRKKGRNKKGMRLESNMISSLLTDLTWSAIDCHPQSFAAINATTISIKELTPSFFFHYLWQMGRLLRENMPKNSFFDSDSFLVGGRNINIRWLSNHDLHAILCASVWTLLEWPKHFHETLENILDARATLKTGRISNASFLHGTARLFNHAAYEWLWVEMEKFADSTHHPERIYLNRYMSRLNKSKSNKSKNMSEPSRQIEPANTHRLSLNEAAHMLDVPARELKKLTSAGIIDTIPKNRWGQRNKWIFNQTHLEALLRKIHGLAVSTDTDEGFLLISDAVKSLGPRGISYSDLLKLLLDGDLQPHYLRDPKTLSSIFVRKIDLDHYVDQIIGEEWSFDRTMIYLGVGPASMIRYHQIGILIPSKYAGKEDYRLWQFAKKDIYGFQNKYVNTAQAAKIIKCQERTVLYWARLRWLPAICGPSLDGARTYLFDKEEIIQWRSKHVRSDEAKVLLNIRQRTMEDWIAKGILHPLKDMSVHPYWFARQEIESLREGNTG